MNFEKMFSTIDTHVAGEAFRIVIQSPIAFVTNDIKEKHEELQSGFENIKNLLLNEPRGHRGMHGCLVGPSAIADFSILFFNHKNVCNFKYEALMATLTGLLETGNIQQNLSNIYQIETNNGIFEVTAEVESEEVIATIIQHEVGNVLQNGQNLKLVTIGENRHYAVFLEETSAPTIELKNLASINKWGRHQLRNLSDQCVDIAGVILVERDATHLEKVRSVTFEPDGYILRSPGVDSTFAILKVLEKEISVIENASIFDSTLLAKRISNDYFSVTAEAFVTGVHQFVFDSEDPLKNGFILA